MSLSLIIRKAALCCWLAIAIPPLLLAQANYTRNGGEYPISGLLPGDQVFPHLNINANGGFLLWQDNATDGSGTGIRAAALDSNFSPVGNSFRVNQIGAGDQEHPQAALFSGGGAIFVWQGGGNRARHIYARFLSSSNTWLAGDVMANTFAGGPQVNPVVATLANGTAVVAWGSFNQQSPGSRQDVYAQQFTPTGQKIGGEFLVNQFTQFNQRTPAIASLADGRFVVVWVSEQQRYDNSVEIYARIFNPGGSPAGDEFLVNAGSTNVCANPSVAASPGGGFAVAWGERDQIVRQSGWDVLARAYSSSGLSGPAQMLNTFIFGDQYAPRISALANGYLAVWTSLGQDGSREGVFGRFLDGAGVVSGEEIRVNTTRLGKQIHPVVVGDSSGRFVAAWSSYNSNSRSFDLFAQHYALPDFVPTPAVANVYLAPSSDPFLTNAPPHGGTGGTPVALKLDFPFPPTPSANATPKGSYSGLFFDTNGVTVSSLGYFTALATDKGSFSAKVLLSGRTYSFTGKFDASGSASKTFVRVGQSSITIQLQLDLASDQIRGTLTDGSWRATLLSDRLVFNKRGNIAPKAGSYTIVIPADPQVANSPGGDGIATVKVDGGGSILFTGTLADGTKVAQKSAVSKQGNWPLYASIYSGRGAVVSWLQFDPQADIDLGGMLVWIKPVGVTGKYYPGGFSDQVWATGSLYTPPALGTKALQLSQGNFILDGGGLVQPMSYSISLSSNNKVTNLSSNKLSLTISASSGLFKGSAVNPQTGKLINFQGVLLERMNSGSGFFLGTNQSGHVYLGPTP